MSIGETVESAIKRDRVVVLIALFFVIALAWVYTIGGVGMEMSALEMTRMSSGEMGMKMMVPAVWDVGYAGLMFFMWWFMMVAMMLPSAAPMVLLFTAINRKKKENGSPFVPTMVFVSAYLITWAGFSVAAVALQWGLERMALLSPMLVSASVLLSGILLLAAGIYQLTPLKQACLKYCRSPLQFIFTRWREGVGGAFHMGFEHGTYCVGCCWFMMGLLFFGGIMNLYWVAGLAIYVLLEKVLPFGHWIGYAVGVSLCLAGGVLVLSNLI